MENIKTISELNSKEWYRALKVLYVFFVVFCFILAITLSYISGSTFYEDKQNYLSEQSDNQKLIDEIKNLKTQGYTPKEITDKVIKPMTGYSPYVLNEINNEESNKLDFALYDKFHHKPSSMNWLFLIIPLIFFLVWLFYSLPKWIFYYIYLGRVNPKNKN